MNASEIPSHGVVRVTGVTSDGQLECDQPNEDGQDVWIASDGAFVSGGYSTVTRQATYARYETSDGTPANGEQWGAGSGSFKLRKGKTGFRIVGNPVNETVLVVPEVIATVTSIHAAIYFTTPPNIPNNTWTYVSTNITEHFDNGSCHSLGVFTAPSDGEYQFGVSGLTLSNNTTTWEVAWAINGSRTIGAVAIVDTNALFNTKSVLDVRTRQLSANDTVRLEFFQTSGLGQALGSTSAHEIWFRKVS